MSRGWIALQIGLTTLLGGVMISDSEKSFAASPIVHSSFASLHQTLMQEADGIRFAQAIPSRGTPANALPQAESPQQPNAPTQRRQTPPSQFPPNPLEITEPDPLIPYDYRDRALTERERKELLEAADRLTAIGTSRLQQGDTIGAFEAWNRELRLRRLAGPLSAEVVALARVGNIAWTQNNTQQLRYITQRLDEIRQQTERPLSQLQSDRNTSPELLNAARRSRLIETLGFAYQQVRLPRIAAGLYQQVLEDARAQNESYKLEATLITLGQLHLAWFDYENAATVYQELLERSQARQDVFNQPLYLNQLIYVHEQAKQPAPAIVYQQQLIQFYQQANELQPIPSLLVKMANNQRSLGQLEAAEANYQLAYQLAQPQSQFSDASNALRGLADMYRENDRLPAALRIYNFLIQVEQQAYNAYGAMEAYDQLGQIYLVQKEYPQALTAFQNGLAIARHLGTQEEYFAAQVEAAQGNGE